MENSIFPVEIFELIIDQHQNMDDRDRSEDLKRFCSVSKGFRQICEPYIFRTISINTEVDYLPTIRKLVNLLVQQPRLSTYIRCMSFTLQGDTRDPSTALPDLPCLPMLEDLQISSRYRTISYSKILYPSGTLEYHLPRHCLSSSTVNLRRVGLCSIDAVPILHILSFPQLEVLDLTYCLLDYETQPSPSVSDSTVFSVRKLVILRTTNFRPSTLHMCSQLEEFRFHPFFPIHTDDITPPTGVNLSLFFRALRALDCYANFDWSAVCGADGATSQKAFPALTTLVLHTGSVRNMDHVNCIFNHFDILEVIDLTISRSNSFSFVVGPLEDLFSLDISRLLLNSINTLKQLTIKWESDLYSSQLLNQVLDAILLLQDDSKLEHLVLAILYGNLTAEQMEQEIQLWSQFLDVIDNPAKYTYLESIRFSTQLRSRAVCPTGESMDEEDKLRLVEEHERSLAKLINHPKVVFDGNLTYRPNL